MRARLLMVAAVLAGLIALQAPGTAGAEARAGTAGACPTLADGVTVVVDPGPLGGTLQVRCAAGAPASGLAALQSAGFSYAFVPGQPGLVCQIDAQPSPCNGAPADADWAYYHAERGGDWAYSTLGAGSYVPEVGSVEGWAFGAGAEPSIEPPPAPVPAPAPAPPPPPGPIAPPSPSSIRPPSIEPPAPPSPSPGPSQPGATPSPLPPAPAGPGTAGGTATTTTQSARSATIGTGAPLASDAGGASDPNGDGDAGGAGGTERSSAAGGNGGLAALGLALLLLAALVLGSAMLERQRAQRASGDDPT